MNDQQLAELQSIRDSGDTMGLYHRVLQAEQERMDAERSKQELATLYEAAMDRERSELTERAERAEAEAAQTREALRKCRTKYAGIIRRGHETNDDLWNLAEKLYQDLQRIDSIASEALQSAPPASEKCPECGDKGYLSLGMEDNVPCPYCSTLDTTRATTGERNARKKGDAARTLFKGVEHRCCLRSQHDSWNFRNRWYVDVLAGDGLPIASTIKHERDLLPVTDPAPADRPEPSEALEVWERLRTRLSSSKTWYASDFEATFYDLQILRRHLDADRHSSVPAVPDSLRQLPYLMRSKANGYRTAGGSGLADEVEEWAAEMEQALSDSAQPAPLPKGCAVMGLVGYAEHGRHSRPGPGDTIVDAADVIDTIPECVTPLYAPSSLAAAPTPAEGEQPRESSRE